MRAPSLKDLPDPPPAKTGWPWTEQSDFFSASGEMKQVLPKFSVVTPSFNQGRYIEETIRSVLLQGYPDFEYIVIDGGSADETVEIIKKYSRWIHAWVSEADRGQSDAINKGFGKASGDFFGFVNSDDMLEKDALASVARCYLENGRPPFIVGDCLIFDETGPKRLFDKWWPENMEHYLQAFGNTLPQPSSFWRKDLHRRVGGFDPFLHYVFDQEFFLKIGLEGVRPFFLEKTLSRYRDHMETKSQDTSKFHEEAVPLVEKYGPRCKLSEKETRKRIQRIANDISYFKTFEIWRRSGRWPALVFFLRRAMKHPDFVLERKVMGLGRRLFMFPESRVVELAERKTL